MTYAPRGFPKAAIEHITEHGPQFTGPLAEAIGCDAGSLSTILATAVQNGALSRVRKLHMGHNVNFYSLGDGVPLERPKDEPLQDHGAAHATENTDRQTPRQVLKAEPAPALSDATARGISATESPRGGAMGAGQSAAAAPADGHATESPSFEFALTSTGRLLIDTGAQQLALSKAEADQLMAYLDAQRGVEWEAA